MGKSKTLLAKRGILKIILVFLLSLIIIAASYVAYVFLSYKRVEDNLPLTPDTIGSPIREEVKLGTTYSVLAFNIGFGAYTTDYSFFMDGGKYSWARNEGALTENISNIIRTVNEIDADFVCFQEVDIDGTRTYHYNEYEAFMNAMGDGDYVFAQNFDSPFLFYPLNEPHGANRSGLVTYSSYTVASAVRRSLPVSESVSKIVDLDRCYSITRIPVENGRYMCIYCVHMSAYGMDASVREAQTSMLFEDMEADRAEGNYVICGGDFNHNLRDESEGNVPEWAQRFPREEMPEGFVLAFEAPGAVVDISHNTCRNVNEPYDPATTFTVLADGFIVSDNVTVETYTNMDLQYAYADHDPVVMEFVLE